MATTAPRGCWGRDIILSVFCLPTYDGMGGLNPMSRLTMSCRQLFYHDKKRIEHSKITYKKNVHSYLGSAVLVGRCKVGNQP